MDIKEIINKRYAMPDASLHKLQQCLTEVSYPKGFQVLKRGKVEKNIFFIKKGIVRAYTSVDGKEITFWFGKEGATIVSLKGYVNDMKYVFTKEGASSLGGFGTIGSIFPTVWDWQVFWMQTAFLSIILAFMNILPIPALDGGHVMFLLYEVIARRKPSDKFLEYAQITGMFLLFALLIYANGNDIFRFFFKS